jgi:putative sterol carrier protein
MTINNRSVPLERNFRQTIEGMPLIFDGDKAGDLSASIQFIAGGKEPGTYHLLIDRGECVFRRGAMANPTLTIRTPSEVWLQIGKGEISGQDALMKGLYKAEGDGSLLIRMGELFKSPENFGVRDETEPVTGQWFSLFNRAAREKELAMPAGKRPAGPLLLSGMTWLMLFFVPWTLFWILFDIRSVNPWVSSGLPLILMSLIVLYRLAFNRPTWMEFVSWLFLAATLVLAALVHDPTSLTWGSVISSLFMGGMWLVSLAPCIGLPFSAEYSKWGFIKKLWANSMFIQPNMAISLMWGWQFLIATGFGIAARMMPGLFIPFTIVRYLLLIPASIFTSRYQKGVLDRKFADIDKTMSALRAWSYIGLAVDIVVLALVLFILKTPG